MTRTATFGANAFRIDMSESVRYFDKWAMNDTVADPEANTTELQELYAGDRPV